ncbi:MAG: hypothetical protein IJJ29_06520 [Solobacterium sp.]|nr:hypothetical protein [Solobacterium sp.]
MINTLRKLFGGLDLTWPKVIAAAVIAGVIAGVIAFLPVFQYTSFHALTVSMEVWILFGIILIMNSKSNMNSALKCFVFFLISQPLVYLVQVPYSALGWGIFGYYRYWFIWTVLCLPMGYIGYYMKKGKWWGYLILLPMIILTAFSYSTYFADYLFCMPRYILICLFCACAMILYPVVIFEDRRIRTFGAAVGAALVMILTVIGLLRPPVYRAEILGNNEEHPFDDSYTVSLADEKYGSVKIIYMPEVEDYMVRAELRRMGSTVLTLVSPEGEKTEFDLSVKRDTCRITQRQ